MTNPAAENPPAIRYVLALAIFSLIAGSYGCASEMLNEEATGDEKTNHLSDLPFLTCLSDTGGNALEARAYRVPRSDRSLTTWIAFTGSAINASNHLVNMVNENPDANFIGVYFRSNQGQSFVLTVDNNNATAPQVRLTGNNSGRFSNCTLQRNQGNFWMLRVLPGS